MKNLLLILVVLGIGTGCDASLDKVWQVKDLRILGVAANPPEIHANDITQWDAPHVSFEALVVHAGKKPVNYSWQFCALESDKSCTDFEDLLLPWEDDFEDLGFVCGLIVGFPEEQTLPDPMTEQRWNGILAQVEALYNNKESGVADIIATEPATLRYAIPSFEVTLFEDLALYNCMGNLLGTTAGWWPSAILTVSDDEKSIISQKRVTLSINDLASEKKGQFFKTIFGAPVCTDEITTDCVPYKNSGTDENSLNVNPRIEVTHTTFKDLQH